MSWISKHSSEHKANLLNDMPIDDHASKGPHKDDPEKKFKKQAKKYLKSVENDPKREQKLDSINKEYLNQFNKYDLGRNPGKNFEVNHYISKMSGRDVPFGMQGPFKKKNWIQEATASIKRRGTEGVCTGDKFGSASCPPGSKRYNLAKTFKKIAKNR